MVQPSQTLKPKGYSKGKRLKNNAEPKPVVVIDTREQLPYNFPSCLCHRNTLSTGDYTVLGHENSFVIERKSINDLLGCIFTDRFEREMERAANIQRFYLVIEGSIWSIRNNNRFQGSPESVLGRLRSFNLRYGIHILFLDNRQEANNYVEALILKYVKHLSIGIKGNDTNAVIIDEI